MKFQDANSEFDQLYKINLDQRWPTFRAALNLLAEKSETEVCDILETGCQRQPDDYGAGCSTTLFAFYLENFALPGGTLTSVDNNTKHMTVCSNLLFNKFNPSNREWTFLPYVEDSLIQLTNFKENHQEFDLIYLDSFDADLEDGVITKKAQKHQLEEAKLAVELFSETNSFRILLLDDNNLPFGGKTKLTREFLAANNWVEILSWQQSLWIKSNG